MSMSTPDFVAAAGKLRQKDSIWWSELQAFVEGG